MQGQGVALHGHIHLPLGLCACISIKLSTNNINNNNKKKKKKPETKTKTNENDYDNDSNNDSENDWKKKGTNGLQMCVCRGVTQKKQIMLLKFNVTSSTVSYFSNNHNDKYLQLQSLHLVRLRSNLYW